MVRFGAAADKKRPIIIDTDPGVDDAVAILLALASPELDIRAMTVVAGNVELPVAAANALRICALAGRGDIPVHAGADRPLRRPLATATAFHGSDGLGGVPFPQPAGAIADGHAADVIVDIVRRSSQPVSICALGPLTNVALALERAPDVADAIAEIVLMGGSWRAGGNVTPAAEFNIWCDPDAAGAVLASGARIVVLPLDATHQALATPERVAALAAAEGSLADVAARLLGHGKVWADRRGMAGPAAHDSTVIGYVLSSELFDGRHVHVAVETASELTRGVTVVDWWGRTGQPANARVITQLDAERFFKLLIDRLGRL